LINANIKSSEWQLKTSQLEIATQVKQVYWQLAYLFSKQKLLAFQDSLYAGFLKAATLKAATGETNKLEMITARSQRLEIGNQLHQTNVDILILKRRLQTLMNTNTEIYIADTVLKRRDFVVANDSFSTSQNPSMGFMLQQVEVSGFGKKLERSRMMPEFNIGYFSQTMSGTQEVNGVPRTFGANDRFNGIQAGISIPLWFVPHNSKIKAAKINQKIAQTNAENYRKSLLGDYQALLEEYGKYSESVDYYEQQAIPEADMIIGQSTQSYKAGAMDYQDYIINLGRALQIRQNYLDALNNCNQTIINIEFITGKIF